MSSCLIQANERNYSKQEISAISTNNKQPTAAPWQSPEVLFNQALKSQSHGVAMFPLWEILALWVFTIHQFFMDVLLEHESSQNGVIDETDWDGESILMMNVTDSSKDFVLDQIFLENWYSIQVNSFKYSSGMDFIQQCAVSSIKKRKR